ncbi:VOC family protein [Streptococcus plurextorum]|uniref:VOC family protein n=1 Tax=Streptococcus plurextorum TaxID=456876 RepID=UPI000418A34F|nr:hypothetical protein [Streptococcus plurextorum]
MFVSLNHVAIATTHYDWYVDLCRTLFLMNEVKSIGDKGRRKCWFKEGIQINEVIGDLGGTGRLDHLALSISDEKDILSKITKYGVEQLDKEGCWLRLPDGLLIECLEK